MMFVVPSDIDNVDIKAYATEECAVVSALTQLQIGTPQIIDNKKTIMEYYSNASNKFLDHETIIINGMDSLHDELDYLVNTLSSVINIY